MESVRGSVVSRGVANGPGGGSEGGGAREGRGEELRLALVVLIVLGSDP